MNFKKAIASAVILYALIFLAGSGLMFVATGTTFESVMVVIVAVLTFLIAKYYYFKGMRRLNAVKDGLMLGVVLVIITIVIDIPVMVYGFAAEQGWSYLMTWHMLLGYLLMLVMPVLAAYKVKRRK